MISYDSSNLEIWKSGNTVRRLFTDPSHILHRKQTCVAGTYVSLVERNKDIRTLYK